MEIQDILEGLLNRFEDEGDEINNHLSDEEKTAIEHALMRLEDNDLI